MTVVTNLPADAHVCFICPYIEPYLKPGSGTHVGGAERQQHLLAKTLRDAGRDVSFITFESDDARYERIDGFDCWRTLPPTNDVKRAPTTLLKLFRSIRRIDADVFYVRGNPPLCILSSYCCSLLGEPLVYVVANDSNVELSRLSTHHGMFERTLPKLGYVDAMRRADRVVTQTEYQRGILADVFGIDSTVIPNGYTVPDESALRPAERREDILWVGSLDPEQKRPERVLELAERLPGVTFRMIGWSADESYREPFIERASTLPNVTFEGFVPPDEIDRHYRDAVALLNTSEYEGFPNTFLEAWRYGVPVVSINEVLDGVLDREGIGVHAGSMDELERAIRTLWSDRQQAGEIGAAGRRYLQRNYSLDTVASEYAEVFALAMGAEELQSTAATT